MDFKENLYEIFQELKGFFKTETVVGNPIQIGSVTLVPLVTVSFGAGGGGNGQDVQGKDKIGGGGGFGGKITPYAIVIIKNEDVNVIPLTEKSPLDNIFEMVPDILNNVNTKDN